MLGPEEHENRESMKHKAMAVHLVNKQISDPMRSTSDDTIGAVMGLVCYAHVTEDLRA